MSESPAPSPAVEKFLRGLSQSPARSRWATVFATLTTLLLLAVCGACGAGLYFFRPQIGEDVARVGVVEGEMLRITVPVAFEPRGTIEWNLFGLVLLRGVYYELADGDGMLMLLQVDSRLMDESDVREHVERTLREQGGGGQPLKITATEEQVFVVRGANVTFRFRQGESQQGGGKFRLVEGVVDGHSGKVLLAFRIAEEAWERWQGDVEATITSIR